MLRGSGLLFALADQLCARLGALVALAQRRRGRLVLLVDDLLRAQRGNRRSELAHVVLHQLHVRSNCRGVVLQLANFRSERTVFRVDLREIVLHVADSRLEHRDVISQMLEIDGGRAKELAGQRGVVWLKIQTTKYSLDFSSSWAYATLSVP